MATVRIPHNWLPRDYQRPMWAHVGDDPAGARVLLLWHRRAGKDDNSLHFMARSAVQKCATYWYMLPEANQVRKAIWDAINPHTGKRRIDEAFPDAVFPAKRGTTMDIQCRNGSMIHFVGSDNYNSLVGSPPYGLVFSEFSLTNPLAWAYLRPILDENGGWALFNGTPRGRNHLATLYEAKKHDPRWFVQRLTADQTGVFSKAQLDDALDELMSLYGPDDGEALFRQEYLVSFDAGLVGSYYGKVLERLDRDGRVGVVPYEPTLPVWTAWDLGMDDSTAIWCAQMVHGEVRLIDYHEASGNGLEYYVNWLRGRGYAFDTHLLPHDVQVKELGTGRSRLETLRSLGLGNVKVVPAQSVADGINAVRTLLPKCRFDEVACKQGLEALRMYRRDYDQERKIYKDRPVHDWTSHGADAFRYLALGMRPDDVTGKAAKFAPLRRADNMRIA